MNKSAFWFEYTNRIGCKKGKISPNRQYAAYINVTGASGSQTVYIYLVNMNTGSIIWNKLIGYYNTGYKYGRDASIALLTDTFIAVKYYEYNRDNTNNTNNTIMLYNYAGEVLVSHYVISSTASNAVEELNNYIAYGSNDPIIVLRQNYAPYAILVFRCYTNNIVLIGTLNPDISASSTKYSAYAIYGDMLYLARAFGASQSYQRIQAYKIHEAYTEFIRTYDSTNASYDALYYYGNIVKHNNFLYVIRQEKDDYYLIEININTNSVTKYSLSTNQSYGCYFADKYVYTICMSKPYKFDIETRRLEEADYSSVSSGIMVAYDNARVITFYAVNSTYAFGYRTPTDTNYYNNNITVAINLGDKVYIGNGTFFIGIKEYFIPMYIS